jgi:hypothetical protein
MKITIIKTSEFTRKASKLLSSHEEQALCTYLASNPLVGKPNSNFPQFLEFGPYGGCYIYYLIGPSMNKVYLCDIDKNQVTASSPEEKTELENLLIEAGKKGFVAGVVVLAKEVGEIAWEALKDYFGF